MVGREGFEPSTNGLKVIRVRRVILFYYQLLALSSSYTLFNYLHVFIWFFVYAHILRYVVHNGCRRISDYGDIDMGINLGS